MIPGIQAKDFLFSLTKYFHESRKCEIKWENMIKYGKIGVKSEKKNLSEKLKLRTEVFKEFHKKDVGHRFFKHLYKSCL